MLSHRPSKFHAKLKKPMCCADRLVYDSKNREKSCTFKSLSQYFDDI